MNKILLVEDFEDKKTKANKVYTRFKTSEGWMSCFNDKCSDILKRKCGENMNLELKESGDFKNIVSIVEGTEETKEVEKTKISTPVSSEKDTSFYTAYAKDIFVALVAVKDAESSLKETMTMSIELVKQAKAAF